MVAVVIFAGAGSEPVDLLAPTLTPDPYSGGSVESWDAPTTTGTLPALVEPVSSTEPDSLDRQAVITGFRLYFDDEAPLSRLDRVRVRGLICNVEGTPALWRMPVTGEPRTVVAVEIVNG